MNSAANSQKFHSIATSGATSLVVMSGTVVALGMTVIAAVVHAAAPMVTLLPHILTVLV